MLKKRYDNLKSHYILNPFEPMRLSKWSCSSKKKVCVKFRGGTCEAQIALTYPENEGGKWKNILLEL
jgi:hypothetical protein